MNEHLAPQAYPQMKLSHEFYFSFCGEKYRTTARGAGEDIARFCHGLRDWQGIRDCEAHSGLAHAANIWLKRHNVSCGKAIVCEVQYGNGISRYYPAWK